MLEAEADLTVVGQTGDARTALTEIGAARPDIAIVDLKLPGMSGLAALGQLHAAQPALGLIVFTMHDNPAYVGASTNAGATGYLLKSATREDLPRAVPAVASGSGFCRRKCPAAACARARRPQRGRSTHLDPARSPDPEALGEGRATGYRRRARHHRGHGQDPSQASLRQARRGRPRARRGDSLAPTTDRLTRRNGRRAVAGAHLTRKRHADHRIAR